MPSTKLENRIILCLVAFGVSCTMGAIASKDVKNALTTGAIATVASFVGGAIVDRKQIKQERIARNGLKNKAQTLKNEIDRLESYEEQLRQSLMTTTTVRQEIELSLNDLDTEKHGLIDQIAMLQYQRNSIAQELPGLSQRKEELEEECDRLQMELEQLNDCKQQFARAIAEHQENVQQNESCLALLRDEYQQLQDYIAEIYNQKEQFDRDLYELENQKQQLLDTVHDLQLHVCQLEAQQQSLSKPEEESNEKARSQEPSPDWSDWNELLDSI